MEGVLGFVLLKGVGRVFMPMDNAKRMDRIRRLLGCSTDSELAEKLGTNQPQVSRWRKTGFYGSTQGLVDALLAVVGRLTKEVAALEKENARLKRSAKDPAE